MVGLNTEIFYAIYELAGRGATGDFLIVFFGEYFIYIVLSVFVIVAYLAYQKKGSPAVLAPYLVAIVAATVARFIVTPCIRAFYHHLRPYVALNLPHLLTDTAYSFPSGHTMIFFSLAGAMYFFNRKLAYLLGAFGLIVGVARIAGGIHYPSDVLGGAVIGAAVGVLSYWFYARFARS